MRRRVKTTLICAGCLMVALILRAQGLIICPACGREAPPGATLCGHCQHALPQPAPETPPLHSDGDKPASTSTNLSQEIFALVVGGVGRARAAETNTPEVALHEYDNTIALARLIDDGSLSRNAGELLVSGRAQTLRRIMRGRDICRICGGTGNYQVNLGKVDGGKSGIRSATGIKCPHCAGTGTLPGFRDINQAKMLILQGRNTFERNRMVAGDTRVGRAFLPPAIAARLDNRQHALVMSAMPLPCPNCQLTGQEPCRHCRSTGWVKCTATGCRDGVLQEVRTAGARVAKRINEETRKMCPVCEGRGEVRCPQCQGRKSVVCAKCKGSGIAMRCQRCTGTGMTPCSKCRGTGNVRGVLCAECRGEGTTLCSSCRGEGALAR